MSSFKQEQSGEEASVNGRPPLLLEERKIDADNNGEVDIKGNGGGLGDLPKKKITGRSRLFVGNLPNKVEAELKELFSPHGNILECYLSGKGFAYIKMDSCAHAHSAKEAIDGHFIQGRHLRVRLAARAALRRNPPTVTNEMLFHAFSEFGDVERAVHFADEKGHPTGEGIVEFERKSSCIKAVTTINGKVALLTASPKPLLVEIVEPRDEDDGFADSRLCKLHQETEERPYGFRFPASDTLDFVCGTMWKELYEKEKQRRAELEDELREARRRLEQEIELAYQAEMVRR
ncbi:hypothetical protein TELCIR_11447, partial [Teladorsagia circumcincta]